MATVIKAEKQGKAEIKAYPVDFTEYIPTGVTVVSATATHIPPTGTALTLTPQVATPYVETMFGPVSVTGIHIVDVLAVLSDGQKSEVRIHIPVRF
jgi:hypothetical protein